MLDDLLGIDDLLRGILEGLEEKIGDALDPLIAPIQTVIDAIQDKVSSGFTDVLANISGVVGHVFTTIGLPLTNVLGIIAGTLDGFITDTTGKLTGISDSLGSVADDVLGKINEGLELTVGVASEVIDDIDGKLRDRLLDTARTLGGVINLTEDNIVARISNRIPTIDLITEPIFARITETVAPALGLIGESIEETLGNVAGGVKGVSDVLSGLLESFLGFNIAKGFTSQIEQVDSVFRELEADEHFGRIFSVFSATGGPHLAPIGLGLLIGLVVVAATSGVQSVFSGLLEKSRIASFDRFRPAIIGVPDLLEIYRRFPEGQEFSVQELGKHGFDGTRQSMLLQLRHQLLGVAELVSLWLRQEIDETTLRARLGQLGYQDADVFSLETLAHPIPPIADLVRMSVREVFDPQIRADFGQDEGFPEEFSMWAQRQGLTEEWAKAYWAAHWELPSLRMGFEMLHRRIIEPVALESLMVALDIMPFWRDKLIQMSFKRLTRVDVRRMHKLNILDDDATRLAYADLGYSPENAQNMLDFTIAFNNPPDDADIEETRALTRAQIVKFYKEGMLEWETAWRLLLDLNYTTEHASLFLNLADVERDSEVLDERIKIVQEGFKGGRIGVNAAVTQLDALEIPPNRRELIMLRLEADFQSRTRLPSRANLGKMVEEGAINATTFGREMTILGYHEPWVTRFWQIHHGQLVEDNDAVMIAAGIQMAQAGETEEILL